MRQLSFFMVLIFTPSLWAQDPATVAKVDDTLKTLRYIAALEDPNGGFKVDKNAKPSVRAINGAARAWRYLNGEKYGQPFPNKAKHIAYVKAHYNATTGAFQETGGTPDGASTSVGILTAVELGIPETDFPKAVDYLKANAKTFEDVRIGAAALEALKKKPEWVKDWYQIASKDLLKADYPPAKEGGARIVGGYVAMFLRLKDDLPKGMDKQRISSFLAEGQNVDGGYGKAKDSPSELETTYRVMRSLYLLKKQPNDMAKLKDFVSKCRNDDGGYGVEPGKPSSMSGVYYSAIIGAWILELK